jgi:hypothetical protein
MHAYFSDVVCSYLLVCVRTLMEEYVHMCGRGSRAVHAYARIDDNVRIRRLSSIQCIDQKLPTQLMSANAPCMHILHLL